MEEETYEYVLSVDIDEIIVLKEGTIAERGTHDQLLKKDGLYSQMWENQEGEGRFQNEE